MDGHVGRRPVLPRQAQNQPPDVVFGREFRDGGERSEEKPPRRGAALGEAARGEHPEELGGVGADLLGGGVEDGGWEGCIFMGRIEWLPTSGRKRVPRTTTTLAAQQRVLSPTPERRRARSFGIREERLGLAGVS